MSAPAYGQTGDPFPIARRPLEEHVSLFLQHQWTSMASYEILPRFSDLDVVLQNLGEPLRRGWSSRLADTESVPHIPVRLLSWVPHDIVGFDNVSALRVSRKVTRTSRKAMSFALTSYQSTH